MAMTRICPADSEPPLASPGPGLADGREVPGGAYAVAGVGVGGALELEALEPALAVGAGLAAAATENWYCPRSRWPSSLAAAHRTS